VKPTGQGSILFLKKTRQGLVRMVSTKLTRFLIKTTTTTTTTTTKGKWKT